MKSINKTKRFLPFILILVGFIFTNRAYASVGRVIAIRNSSWATNNNDKRDLKIKSNILKKDVIETSKRARLQIMFNDDTIASLGPKSTMIVNDFNWNEKQGRFNAEAKEGIFRIMGGKIVKNSPENFKIKTPVASIGIRGSMFAFRVNATKLSIVFLGGKGIDITTNFGKVALIKPGFGTNISKVSKKIDTPRKFTVQEINNLLKATAPSEKKEKDNKKSVKEKKVQTKNDKKQKSTKEEAKNDEGKNQGSKITSTEKNTKSVGKNTESTEKKLTSVPKIDSLEKKIVEHVIDAAETPEDIKVIVQTIVNDASTDKNHEDIKTTIKETVSNPDNTGTNEDQNTNTTETRTTVGTPGNHTDALMGKEPEANNSFYIRQGTVSGEIVNGELTTITKDKSDNIIASNNFGTFPNPEQDSSTEYTGQTEKDVNYTININGGPKTFVSKLYTSNLGEFYVLNTPATILDSANNNEIYAETSYFGKKFPSSSNLKDSGYSQYIGVATGAAELNVDSTQYITGISGQFAMRVNWTNKRFMGALYDTSSSNNASTDFGPPGFFFGSVDNTGAITGFKFVSSIPTTPPDSSPSYWPNVSTAYGETADGNIFGTKYQGIGISSSANVIDIKNGSVIGDASLTIGGFRNKADITASLTSASNKWNGFITGIGEDISSPSQNRKYFMNKYPEEVDITLDRTNGVLNGKISASKPQGYPAQSLDLTIGGDASNSVYIDEKVLFGMISGSVKGENGSSNPPVNQIESKSSYLVSEKAVEPISDYVTWGYWEAAYNDPDDSSKTYHIHVPASLWVAGELTPDAYLSSLKVNSQTLNYSGSTYSCTSVDGSKLSSLINGSINMTVDFGLSSLSGSIIPDSANNPLKMDFDGSLSSSGNNFYGYFKNDTAGSLNGAFFGPSANTAAGNFEATNNNTKYTGIFIGNK